MPEGKPRPPETAGPGSLQLGRLLHSPQAGSSLGPSVCFPFSWDSCRDGCREDCRRTNHQRPNPNSSSNRCSFLGGVQCDLICNRVTSPPPLCWGTIHPLLLGCEPAGLDASLKDMYTLSPGLSPLERAFELIKQFQEEEEDQRAQESHFFTFLLKSSLDVLGRGRRQLPCPRA